MLIRLAIVFFLLALPPLGHATAVHVLSVDGAIGPATASYLEHGIADANDAHAEALIIELNTPGGLDASMRSIIRAMLASPVPVVVYVAPEGARAASAGTYILYASAFAAMAPATNLGAATPVALGGGQEEKGEDGKESTLHHKQTNDAVAFIRALAQKTGRNAEWAEKAVAEAATLTAGEALEAKVIEAVAPDLDSLLETLDGKSLRSAEGERLLATRGAEVVRIPPDWRIRLLAILTDPSIAYILLLIGIYGLFFEFYNPGMIAPGVIGAIALLLALFALQMLPISYAGLALVLTGLAFMVAEAFVPSFGALGIGGLAAFVLGSIMLFDADVPGFTLPLGIIAAAGGLCAAATLFVVGAAIRTRRRPKASGGDELIGTVATLAEDAEEEGWAILQGENWRVLLPQPAKKGDRVRVVSRKGLTLTVEPMDKGESS